MFDKCLFKYIFLELMPIWIGAVRNRFHRYAWTYCDEPQILVNRRYWAEAHPQIQNTHAMFYGEKAVSTCAVDIYLPYVCQGMYSPLFFYCLYTIFGNEVNKMKIASHLIPVDEQN